jgi:DNA/RNA endonuclease G (NUC1)
MANLRDQVLLVLLFLNIHPPGFAKSSGILDKSSLVISRKLEVPLERWTAIMGSKKPGEDSLYATYSSESAITNESTIPDKVDNGATTLDPDE